MSNFRAKYILWVATLLLFSQIAFGFVPTLRANSAKQPSTGELLQDTVRSAQRRSQRAANNSIKADTTNPDSIAVVVNDSTVRRAKAALTMPIEGRATDSLHYDLRTKKVYLYEQGEVSYDKFNLKADFMDIDLNTNNVLAYGRPDSVDGTQYGHHHLQHG